MPTSRNPTATSSRARRQGRSRLDTGEITGGDAGMAHDVTIRRAVEADAGILLELLGALSCEIGYEAAFRADPKAQRKALCLYAKAGP